MSSMSEARFHDLVDEVQATVEDAFDDSDLDVDLENSGGVLTVRFENGSQLILSRQPALRQLWVAARSGGYHYKRVGGEWRNTRDDSEFYASLSKMPSEQGGAALSIA